MIGGVTYPNGLPCMSARPGNPHNRGQIFPSERFKVG